MSTAEYGIVLIDYNSLERTQKYIKDILTVFDLLPKQIVIIDNYLPSDYSEMIPVFVLKEDNKDNYPEKYCKYIKQAFKGEYAGIEIVYVKSKDNLGFAKANNFGVAILDSCDIKYALISNSDIVFENTLKITSFIKILEDNENALAVGSDVFRIDGTRQSPCKYLSIYDRWWRGKLLWPLLKLFYKEKSEIIEPEKLTKVYRLIGAFLMVNVEHYKSIGGMDENTFLYGEELILAERAKSNNLEIIYFPGEKVIHEDGYTTKRTTNTYNKMTNQLSSDIYYYQKYIGISKLTSVLTKIIVKSYCLKKNLITMRFSKFK